MSDADELARARAKKALAKRQFSRFGQVSGVGITRVRGRYGLKVNLARAPKPGEVLPNDIEGVPVQVEVVGQIRKRAH